MNDVEYLQSCSHEEADTRILLHVAHCARQGLRKVRIRKVDTDVVVRAIGHFPALRLDELWFSFGVGTHFRQIAIHEIVKNVNEKALMLFHAISGCDTVSSYVGRGKKSTWLAWSYCPSVTYDFLDVSLQPIDVSSETLEKIERLIVFMYSISVQSAAYTRQGKCCSHNVLGQWRTSHQPNRRCYNMCDARHTKQGMCDHRPLSRSPSCLVRSLGWLTSDSGWKPFWTELTEASTACYERVHCGCKKGCRRQCKCRSSNLQCTELCKCSGACGDNVQ